MTAILKCWSSHIDTSPCRPSRARRRSQRRRSAMGRSRGKVRWVVLNVSLFPSAVCSCKTWGESQKKMWGIDRTLFWWNKMSFPLWYQLKWGQFLKTVEQLDQLLQVIFWMFYNLKKWFSHLYLLGKVEYMFLPMYRDFQLQRKSIKWDNC